MVLKSSSKDGRAAAATARAPLLGSDGGSDGGSDAGLVRAGGGGGIACDADEAPAGGGCGGCDCDAAAPGGRDGAAVGGTDGVRGGSWTPDADAPGPRVRRGGSGGRRRPHCWHTASSSAFSALQNGQNLNAPRPPAHRGRSLRRRSSARPCAAAASDPPRAGHRTP